MLGGGNAEEGSNYEDGWQGGDADESTVKSIRFYFFYDGAPTPIDLVSGFSYRDFVVTDDVFGDVDGDGDYMPNVEHKLAATVVLHRIYNAGGSPTGLPNQVVAIVNPTAKIKTDLGTKPALSEVKNYVLETLALDKTEGTFVMTNSVYADKGEGGDATFDAVEIDPDAFFHTENEAKESDKRVKIYVERVVAKLDLTIENDEENYWDAEGMQPKMSSKPLGSSGLIGYNTYVKYKDEDEELEAYVTLKGWNVTATANKSFLVKNINPEWPGAVDNILDAANLFQTANEPWNFAAFYRSYWAYNPENVQLEYGTFNNSAVTGNKPENNDMTDKNPALAHSFAADAKNICYLPENAGKSGEDAANASPTQVIIGAQLVDENGAPLMLAEFMGSKFVYNNNYTNVKNAILNALLNTNKYYKKKEDGTYVSMSSEDIEIKSALDLLKDDLLDATKTGRYFVYAQLTEAAKNENVKWLIYKGTYPVPDEEELTEEMFTDIKDAEAPQKTGAEIINEGLMKLPAKIWESGNTYYFLNIRHLAEPNITAVPEGSTEGTTVEGLKAAVPGYYGVVRNHVYKTKITGIFGLGTPVFDPDEIIIPEKPEEEEVFLAAEINILSWRIVDHGYDLNW